jgi:hypothetical protein
VRVFRFRVEWMLGLGGMRDSGCLVRVFDEDWGRLS